MLWDSIRQGRKQSETRETSGASGSLSGTEYLPTYLLCRASILANSSNRVPPYLSATRAFFVPIGTYGEAGPTTISTRASALTSTSEQVPVRETGAFCIRVG